MNNNFSPPSENIPNKGGKKILLLVVFLSAVLFIVYYILTMEDVKPLPVNVPKLKFTDPPKVIEKDKYMDSGVKCPRTQKYYNGKCSPILDCKNISTDDKYKYNQAGGELYYGMPSVNQPAKKARIKYNKICAHGSECTICTDPERADRIKQCENTPGEDRVYNSIKDTCYLKPDCKKCEFIEKCGCDNLNTMSPDVVAGSFCDCGLKMKCDLNEDGDTCIIPSGKEYSKECGLANGRIIKNNGCCQKSSDFGDIFLSNKAVWIDRQRLILKLHINMKTFKPSLYYVTINYGIKQEYYDKAKKLANGKQEVLDKNTNILNNFSLINLTLGKPRLPGSDIVMTKMPKEDVTNDEPCDMIRKYIPLDIYVTLPQKNYTTLKSILFETENEIKVKKSSSIILHNSDGTTEKIDGNKIFDGSYWIQVKYQDVNCGKITYRVPGCTGKTPSKRFIIRSEDDFIGTGINFKLKPPQFNRPEPGDINGINVDLDGNIIDKTFITGKWTCGGAVGYNETVEPSKITVNKDCLSLGNIIDYDRQPYLLQICTSDPRNNKCKKIDQVEQLVLYLSWEWEVPNNYLTYNSDTFNYSINHQKCIDDGITFILRVKNAGRNTQVNYQELDSYEWHKGAICEGETTDGRVISQGCGASDWNNKENIDFLKNKDIQMKGENKVRLNMFYTQYRNTPFLYDSIYTIEIKVETRGKNPTSDTNIIEVRTPPMNLELCKTINGTDFNVGDGKKKLCPDNGSCRVCSPDDLTGEVKNRIKKKCVDKSCFTAEECSRKGMAFPSLYYFNNEDFNMEDPYSNCQLIVPTVGYEKTASGIGPPAQCLHYEDGNPKGERCSSLNCGKECTYKGGRVCHPPKLENGKSINWDKYNNGLPDNQKNNPIAENAYMHVVRPDPILQPQYKSGTSCIDSKPEFFGSSPASSLKTSTANYSAANSNKAWYKSPKLNVDPSPTWNISKSDDSTCPKCVCYSDQEPLLSCNLLWKNYSDECFVGDSGATGGGVANPNCKITYKDAKSIKRYSLKEANNFCRKRVIKEPGKTDSSLAEYSNSKDACTGNKFPSNDGMVLTRDGSSIAQKDITHQVKKRMDGVDKAREVMTAIIVVAAVTATIASAGMAGPAVAAVGASAAAVGTTATALAVTATVAGVGAGFYKAGSDADKLNKLSENEKATAEVSGPWGSIPLVDDNPKCTAPPKLVCKVEAEDKIKKFFYITQPPK